MQENKMAVSRKRFSVEGTLIRDHLKGTKHRYPSNLKKLDKE
jgi:hypothetical protein